MGDESRECVLSKICGEAEGHADVALAELTHQRPHVALLAWRSLLPWRLMLSRQWVKP